MAGVWALVEVRVSNPLGLTETVKPRGNRQLACLRIEAAMSGAVAAMRRAFWWGNGKERGAKKRWSAAGNGAVPLLGVKKVLDTATWAAVATPLPLFSFLVVPEVGAAALA